MKVFIVSCMFLSVALAQAVPTSQPSAFLQECFEKDSISCVQSTVLLLLFICLLELFFVVSQNKKKTEFPFDFRLHLIFRPISEFDLIFKSLNEVKWLFVQSADVINLFVLLEIIGQTLNLDYQWFKNKTQKKRPTKTKVHKCERACCRSQAAVR